MSKLKENYTVVLRSDLPPLEKEFLEQLCFKVTSKDDSFLLVFRCTEVDTSHHYFINMETFKSKKDEFTMPIQVPLHYVILISGSKDRPSIGFVREGILQ